MRNARDKSSEVGKLSRAFSRSVESSDWLFVCLQISCLKSGDYHVDFSRSVSERLAWIDSPTPNHRPIFLLLHFLLLGAKHLTLDGGGGVDDLEKKFPAAAQGRKKKHPW